MDDSGPEPTQAPGGGDQIRKYLEEWRQKYKEGEERYRAEREEAARSDDGLACAEERLAAKRAAELEEIQLTSTGTEMTAEKHVATAETHLQYAEGHLQPSEEHLADAEVHLKLVKAHLAALVAMEPAGADPPEAATQDALPWSGEDWTCPVSKCQGNPPSG